MKTRWKIPFMKQANWLSDNKLTPADLYYSSNVLKVCYLQCNISVSVNGSCIKSSWDVHQIDSRHTSNWLISVSKRLVFKPICSETTGHHQKLESGDFHTVYYLPFYLTFMCETLLKWLLPKQLVGEMASCHFTISHYCDIINVLLL